MYSTEKHSKLSKNIHQQSVKNILKKINKNDENIPEIVKKSIPTLEKLVNACVKSLKNKGRVIYLGSGHTGDLCYGDAQETTITFGLKFGTFRGLHLQIGPNWDWETVDKINLTNRDGSENGKMQFIEDLKSIAWNPNDIVIGISASGNTNVTIEALKWVKKQRGKTGCIVNNKNSLMEKVVDFPVAIEAGPEIVSGSTRMKSGTISKMIINMLSTTCMTIMGNVYKGLMVNLKIGPKNSLMKFEERAIKIIMEATNCKRNKAVQTLDNSDNKTKDKSLRSIKVTIIMIKKNIDAKSAKILLKKVCGDLAKII